MDLFKTHVTRLVKYFLFFADCGRICKLKASNKLKSVTTLKIDMC